MLKRKLNFPIYYCTAQQQFNCMITSCPRLTDKLKFEFLFEERVPGIALYLLYNEYFYLAFKTRAVVLCFRTMVQKDGSEIELKHCVSSKTSVKLRLATNHC